MANQIQRGTRQAEKRRLKVFGTERRDPLVERFRNHSAKTGRITLWSVFIAVFVTGLPLLAEPVVSPSVESGSRIDHGFLLVSELNCAACHEPPSGARERLTTRLSPVLGNRGMRLTPNFIRDFVDDPHRVKPGTTMPDILGTLPASERAATAEALTHFLVWAQGVETDPETSVDPHKIEVGKRLYHQVGCVACHAPSEPAATFSPSPAGANENSTGLAAGDAWFETNSVPLSPMGSKTSVGALTRFLLNPQEFRPSARMPSMNLSEGEASSIAMYLARDQAKPRPDEPPPMRLPGLRYQYFEEAMTGSNTDFDRFAPKVSGDIQGFEIKNARRSSGFGFAFSGTVTVETEGRHTFHVRSDDGSRLYIGGKLVVDNWGDHGPQEIGGSVTLSKGDHPILLNYFNNGGGADLAVAWEGPGFSRREIPASALSHVGRPMRPVGSRAFSIDLAKVSVGRRKFLELRCNACHSVGAKNPADAIVLAGGGAKPLQQLIGSAAGGCVKRTSLSRTPDFRLSDSQRAVLSDALAAMRSKDVLVEAKSRVAHRLATLNCHACHSRDGIGGPEPRRSDYFSVVGGADLGDEGRMPPHLTKVGAKLRGAWLREVLYDRGTVRPYMATRMPQFGRETMGRVADEIEAADSGANTEEFERVASKDAKWGRKLVGRDGLTCIACHVFGKHKSLGIPAMDLTQMTKRLKKSWFEKYLVDPASLRPGTRMPSFWPDGRSVNRELLDGDGPRQINAIWAFLSKGAAAEVPEGLIQGQQELIPGEEPMIYRNFIAGAGSRAIAVGYPEKAHAAFDANELRLALLWRGAFIDAARHRTDRGVGFEPPLGDDVLRLPEGSSFAVLGKEMPEWPVVSGAKAGQRFLGYSLDARRRPTFRYSIGPVQVEDQPLPKLGEVDPHFMRYLTLKSAQPLEGLWFRAARGDRITKQGQGWSIDARWNIRFTSAGTRAPVVRSSAGKQELLVPVEWKDGLSRIEEEITW